MSKSLLSGVYISTIEVACTFSFLECALIAKQKERYETIPNGLVRPQDVCPTKTGEIFEPTFLLLCSHIICS